MRGFKIIWGILLAFALILAGKAAMVFLPSGTEMAEKVSAAVMEGTLRCLNSAADYSADKNDKSGSSALDKLLGFAAVNKYASGADLPDDWEESETTQRLAEDEEGEDHEISTAEEGMDADSYFLIGSQSLFPDLPSYRPSQDDGKENANQTLPVEYAEGGVEPVFVQSQYPDWSSRLQSLYPIDEMKNLNYLLRNFYILDSSTSATEEVFDIEELLSKDLTIEKKSGAPQILIYHTHASEGYIDSRKGNYEDTVMGVGDYLTEILTEQYGYEVYHDKNVYDMKNGKDNRNYAYTTALPYITKILKENPSIEVVIDLHRDGGEKRVTEIDGKKTAQIMLFNGLCRNANGPLTDLANPYLQDNLAFSLKLNMVGRAVYPGLMFKMYLKNYRYNMHLCPKSLLVELGTNQNTLEEARNAMPYFASVLDQVLNSR